MLTRNIYLTQCARVWQARYLYLYYLPLAGREGPLDMKSER